MDLRAGQTARKLGYNSIRMRKGERQAVQRPRRGRLHDRGFQASSHLVGWSEEGGMLRC